MVRQLEFGGLGTEANLERMARAVTEECNAGDNAQKIFQVMREILVELEIPPPVFHTFTGSENVAGLFVSNSWGMMLNKESPKTSHVRGFASSLLHELRHCEQYFVVA